MTQTIGMKAPKRQDAQNAQNRDCQNIPETKQPETPQRQHELNWRKTFNNQKFDLTKILIQKIWIKQNMTFLKTAVTTKHG